MDHQVQIDEPVSCSYSSLPVIMEIVRDEEFEVLETRVGQLLCDVLDRNVRMCDDPNCVRHMLRDLVLNYGRDYGGLSITGRSLTHFMRNGKKMQRLSLQ